MRRQILVSDIVRHAEQIAAATGITREEAIRELKIAHENLGIEVEPISAPKDGKIALDFTETDLKKTWPMSPMRVRP